MTSRAIQHNPLIQALQLAGADWLWPGEALSVFWRTTTETMTQAGWAGYSNPWQWKDIHAAHLQRLGMPDCDALNGGFRLEACAAVWLHDKSELLTHWGAACALRDVYLPRIDNARCDEEAAVFWAAMLAFSICLPDSAINGAFAEWRAASPNAMRWVQAHQIVYPFGLELWPTARHMHRIVNNADVASMHISLEGLLS